MLWNNLLEDVVVRFRVLTRAARNWLRVRSSARLVSQEAVKSAFHHAASGDELRLSLRLDTSIEIFFALVHPNTHKRPSHARVLWPFSRQENTADQDVAPVVALSRTSHVHVV